MRAERVESVEKQDKKPPSVEEFSSFFSVKVHLSLATSASSGLVELSHHILHSHIAVGSPVHQGLVTST